MTQGHGCCEGLMLLLRRGLPGQYQTASEVHAGQLSEVKWEGSYVWIPSRGTSGHRREGQGS